ncbi:hypothetical protein [Actinoplanes sp. NPDC051851]|uniref:hypothetical protein n=1 Tax=Actinoplanes sp. NPDC051851 TaxID=3154753 RepID=UPI003412F863
MAIPSRVPIAHEPGYRTDTIGTYDDGQFFGSVTAVLVPGDKRWYAVLHRFDAGGRHRESEIRAAGSPGEASELLTGWLGALPGRAFGDIAVGLFQVEVDGHVFGLIDGSEEYDGEDHAELVPDMLGFDDPWDGLYDT